MDEEELDHREKVRNCAAVTIPILAQAMEMPIAQLAQQDIALLNLSCAIGLPNGPDENILRYLE